MTLDGEADDHRMSWPDAVLPFDLVAHLQECLQARAAVRLGYVLAAAAHGGLGLERVEEAGDLVDIDPGVPDLEESHRGVVRHLGAVAVRGQACRGAGIAVAEFLIAGGDGKAGRQPLEIPVERGRERLIEIVHVEDQPPVGRGEHAEVQQVRVTAGLHPDVGRGRVREIPCHRRRRAAEVRERRGSHAPIPDRDQIRHPAAGLLLEHGDRVRPARRRLPLCMARAGRPPAVLAPPAPPLIRREQLVLRGKNARRHSAHSSPTPRS